MPQDAATPCAAVVTLQQKNQARYDYDGRNDGYVRRKQKSVRRDIVFNLLKNFYDYVGT